MPDSVGDLLIAVLYTENVNSAAITAPTGWSFIESNAYIGLEGTLNIYHRYADGSEPASYSFGGTGYYDAAAILRYSHVPAGVPFAGTTTFFEQTDPTPGGVMVAPSIFVNAPSSKTTYPTVINGFITYDGKAPTTAVNNFYSAINAPLTQRVSTYQDGDEGMFLYDAQFNTSGSFHSGETMATLASYDSGIGFTMAVNTGG